MTSILVPMSEEMLDALKKRAQEASIESEQLVQAAVNEMLARKDDTFKRALEYVLDKNRELYQHLAKETVLWATGSMQQQVGASDDNSFNQSD